MRISIGEKSGQRVFIDEQSVMQQQVEDLQVEILELVQKFPRKWKIVFAVAAFTLAADIIFSGGAMTAAAGIESVDKAFVPIKQFLIALADPICYVMFVWGCIECIVGRAASGLNRIKYAAIGFIAINWIPMLMGIIRDVGGAPLS